MSAESIDWSRERVLTRAEDVAWMATNGETTQGAAQRLDITLETLHRWCHRHRPDLWHRLVANQHQPGHVPRGRTTPLR